MTQATFATVIDQTLLKEAAEKAARAIPPLWPLASSVAVNPFLGQVDETLADVAARLGRIAGIEVTMPRSWYAAKIAKGEVTDDDLAAALARAPVALRSIDAAILKKAVLESVPPIMPLPTVADLVAEECGTDWPGLIAERFGAWAASYFDEGQALWGAPPAKGAYAAWRAVATHDLTPEIAGLKGFAAFVAAAPESASAAIVRAADRLGLALPSLDTYFHQLLMSLSGWGQLARYKLWQAELAGSDDATITDFLAIRLLWEEALFATIGPNIASRWIETCAAHAAPIRPTRDQSINAVLQEAAEHASQRKLAQMFAVPAGVAHERRPALQAAFCIDVRSEIFRRALESADPSIQTLGFAGFFGLTASHKRFGSDVSELRLPVLLNAGVTSVSGGPEHIARDQSERFAARSTRAWGRFKLAAVSSFAFVEATGPLYVAKLFRDALGLPQTLLPNDPTPRLEPALNLEARTGAAESVLRAMSLTRNFARVVLLAGHGAKVVNNPHASSLHCGACGGYSGEVNARLLAALLNDPAIRKGLVTKGIVVPEDTLFVGGLHDTTTDAVLLYADDHPSTARAPDLDQVKRWLAAAGRMTRSERALRLPRSANGDKVRERSRDWSEVRPEWALAGCKDFIAAPRGRTAGKSLEGRAFLHDYDWKQDTSFGVLELIMTAPVVVASWISLQYYGSTVAPAAFGAGNKLLHNVAGGIGVVEGNGGLLRGGLPWQSVHDGDNYMHEPLRLSVCIEAPREAMIDVLRKHEGLRALFDNRWLHLFALDDAGRMAWRYSGDLEWEPVTQDDQVEGCLGMPL